MPGTPQGAAKGAEKGAADKADKVREMAGTKEDAVVPAAADEPRQTSLSPVALRILGAQRSSAQLAQKRDVSTRKLRVALGDDWIEVVLAEAPAASSSKQRDGHTWLAATPYLVWTPLPHDVPEGGDAFVCVGAGDQGCLFIDLGAAPGAVAIGGDRAAARRLAESMAHQLCVAAAAGSPVSVIAVGKALPQPLPSRAAGIDRLDELELDSAGDPDAATRASTQVVFCELRSNEEAFALARYTNSSHSRVIPVILANLDGAPWFFTARPRNPGPRRGVSPQVVA